MTIPSAVQLGPLMLAMDRALAVVLIAAFLAVTAIVAKKMDPKADRAGWWAFGAGILAARAGYIAINWDAFAAEPVSALAVWQGGFSLTAGLAASLTAIALVLRLKRPAVVLASSVVLLSGAYHLGSSFLRADPRPIPSGLVVASWAGRPLAFSQLRGRPFVVNLWASWCLPCRREMPMLVDVASKSSVPILLVNSGEQRAAAGRFLHENRLPSRSVYLDPNASVAGAVGAFGYPATLFVNAAGQIETVHLGELSRATLSSELQKLEKEGR